MPELYWLPEDADWKTNLASASQPEEASWTKFVHLAKSRLDFLRTNQLDHLLQSAFGERIPAELSTKPIRLAVLASSTVTHLLAGIRVAALRRGLHLQVYFPEYGQYRQELIDASSPLHRFAPNVVLFAIDTRRIIAEMGGGLDAPEKTAAQLSELWQKAQSAFNCQVIQQALLPVFPLLIGSNEHRLAGSRAWRVSAFNHILRKFADASGVDLLALDAAAQRNGIDAWHDAALWHRAKQEVHPAASPLYGELCVRLIAAQSGLSCKCLVLDLDNTLWGGVIGDDGLDGIVLGQGSALGEAYVDFQRWVQDQARRGVLLAVCSKNDEANAESPFGKHPEMVLSRADITAFVANWEDKPSNLRKIAQSLNIGIDSLVFVDDNPFERNIVRRELPTVAVPELPEDPALYSICLSDAGYFEALTVTADDMARGKQYQANVQRQTLQAAATDLNAYLASLQMNLLVKPFDRLDLKRIVQLINKTNQFNLTTRRYTETQVEGLIGSPDTINLCFRLTDSLGDNGIISVIIGRLDKPAAELTIDTWLMSCRVLGRQVENACMNVLAAKAKAAGAREITGEFIPTVKNDMVKQHYEKLMFRRFGMSDLKSLWKLELEEFVPFDTLISVREASVNE